MQINTKEKASIELSNLAIGAVLNILEITTLGQPLEVSEIQNFFQGGERTSHS